jgi:hypothetical protein
MASNGQRIPFLIQGTGSDPKFVPEVGGLAAEMLKAQLGTLAAPGATPQQQANTNNPLGGLGGLFKRNQP